MVLLNTCAIREHAEQKIFSRLGALREQLSRSTAASNRYQCSAFYVLALPCCCSGASA